MSTVKELEQKVHKMATAEDYSNLSSRVDRIEDKLTSDKFDKRVEQIIEKFCQMEGFKNRTKNIINDQSKQDDFIQRIKKYAGREIDDRKLKSYSIGTLIVITASITIITTVIAQVIITKILN
jgi:hypothetical protein